MPKGFVNYNPVLRSTLPADSFAAADYIKCKIEWIAYNQRV